MKKVLPILMGFIPFAFVAFLPLGSFSGTFVSKLVAAICGIANAAFVLSYKKEDVTPLFWAAVGTIGVVLALASIF